MQCRTTSFWNERLGARVCERVFLLASINPNPGWSTECLSQPPSRQLCCAYSQSTPMLSHIIDNTMPTEHAPGAAELSPKVGDGGNRGGGISCGGFAPPLLPPSSAIPCPKIT